MIVLFLQKCSGVYGRTALATDWIMETLGQIDILRNVLFIENYEFSIENFRNLNFYRILRRRSWEYSMIVKIIGFTIMIMALKVDF